ncbi:hypothetical protein HG536_0D02530 [Torulaspora globosa]|uniref:Attractin/MKLN-like beta-propeller domain-containing protein n=1 Tax=Torulaspora globosa TaxID=48254 RepID=A0A7G3ZGU5_9SACH|nr:uncharacterized protein HG536_0D02530 [Torulaspora globosa]QLL32731.1 hypothetical protein HG536_0D02530 [Torulaspora globosa]
MHLLQPSSCSCYNLKLPTPPAAINSEPLDASMKRRYTLDCRTGAAVELTRSNIFVHGGLTIPLNLTHVNSVQIQKELILYFAKEKVTGSSFKRLSDWISSETFFLDLITRTWERVETTIEEDTRSDDDAHDEGSVPVFKERLYHSMCFAGSCLYIFGGLVVSPDSGYELIATNELWKLDLQAKKWSLVSKDPQITRRFTHSMHTLNEEDDSKDTKIVIAGGLNNIDKPVYRIDIFNVTKNCWETETNSSSPCRMFANVEGEKVALMKESNYSILVENNEAKIPSLVFYAAEKEGSPKGKNKSVSASNEGSPIVALPLLSESQGMRMISNQSSVTMDMPSNLQYPTGDYFCYTIVMAGFYPNCQASSFCCFVYDIPSGRWTRVSIDCKEGDINKHRFWKLFVWQSHHQTILLGERNDDDFLPSVQKFDFLLTFGLPMISIYNKGVRSSVKQGFKVPAHETSQTSDSPSSLSFPSDRNITVGQDGGDFRKASYASTSTSQFESYIQYIAPPIEMTSIRTVFPPYAMVLGKDALEIFGNPLSDFEFITDKGDSIGVPLYLLRKRWGRYFDMLLSQGYVRACAEYENSGTPSEIIKISPYSSQAMSFSKNSDVSSAGPLDAYFTSKGQRRKSLSKAQDKVSTADEESVPAEHRLSHLMSNSSTPAYFENDDEDPVSPPGLSRMGKEHSNRDTKTIHRIGTGSTTSSSGGMVFRVPFQENPPLAYSDTNLVKPPGVEEKRRSSSVANAALDYLRPNHLVDRWRRASHPNSSISSPEDSRFHGSSTRFAPPSGQSSRNTSITSQTSSVSYVSSSSDRMGNSIFAQGAGTSNIDSPLGTILNIALPPQTNMPNDPLPPVPQDATNANSRRNSLFVDFALSNRSSPFSSRRPSHDRRSSSSEAGRPLDQFQTSLDRQLMEDRGRTAEAASGHHRSFFSKLNSRSADSGSTSSSKVSTSDGNRLSLCSNPESTESGASGPLEWEPLLTPRTLYMPWPTATVRAFAEFFFTGHVNGKWALAPVVLNLLLMSKMYEIPLLYNLITEVLYSIVGRKEDSLYVICASMTDAFHSKVAAYCNNDETLIRSYLEGDELYTELVKVRQSLENIDNGTFDLDLIQKVTRAFSSSTHRSSESGIDKSSTAGTSTFRSSVAGGNNIPTVFAGGPRDSQDSDGSLVYPPSLSFPRRNQSTGGANMKSKKKSSLSQEISSTLSEMSTPSTARVSSDTALNTISDKLSEERESMVSDDDESSTSSSVSSDLYKELDDENYATDEEYETTIIDARTSGYCDDEEEDIEYRKNISKLGNISQKNKSDDSASSQSESDGINSELGLLSINKMKRKIAGQLDLEESIDPLFKTGFNPQSPARDSQSRDKFTTASDSARDRTTNEATSPTLENLASPNALPPVDYVIKSIARTAALVNYPRLIVRCLDCLEISKRLRSIKRRLAAHFTKLDEECSVTTPQEVLKRRLLDKQKSDSALAKSMCTSASWNVVSQEKKSPQAEKIRSNSAMPSEHQLSPKTSLSRGASDSLSAGILSRKSQFRLGGDESPIAGDAPILMNPAFMPPPPASSSRGKKTYGSSSTGGFSFFGKKK